MDVRSSVHPSLVAADVARVSPAGSSARETALREARDALVDALRPQSPGEQALQEDVDLLLGSVQGSAVDLTGLDLGGISKSSATSGRSTFADCTGGARGWGASKSGCPRSRRR